MAKMGRPKKEETKDKAVGIRLSNESYARLLQYSAQHKLTITQVVQKALDNLFQS